MNLTPEFMHLLESVTNKRARFVIDTILKKGFCTTEDIKNAGYEHAPRAARDVRELGIPLVTDKVKDSTGKTVASYTFGDWNLEQHKNQLSKTGGRSQLSAKLKQALIEKYGLYCNLYREQYPARLLQPDHRVPYEIGGDPEDMLDTDYFMLLSPSANREKSWTCEHCPNWFDKSVEMCESCYYAFPEDYTHIAGQAERKVELVFQNAELPLYEALESWAKYKGVSVPELIKEILSEGIK